MLLSNLATALRHDGELERAESLAREALAALTHALGSAHPNVARVYDSGMSRGLYYYAMELVEGVHLDQLVKQKNLGRRLSF